MTHPDSLYVWMEVAALRARLAEAERLLRDVEGYGTIKSQEEIPAFLAGSATPPEAPQQTAPARLAAVVAVANAFAQAIRGNWGRDGRETKARMDDAIARAERGEPVAVALSHNHVCPESHAWMDYCSDSDWELCEHAKTVLAGAQADRP